MRPLRCDMLDCDSQIAPCFPFVFRHAKQPQMFDSCLQLKSKPVRIAEVAVGESIEETKAGDAAEAAHPGDTHGKNSMIESQLRELNWDSIDCVRARESAAHLHGQCESPAAGKTKAFFQDEIERGVLRTRARIRQQVANETLPRRRLVKADFDSRPAVKQRPEGARHQGCSHTYTYSICV